MTEEEFKYIIGGLVFAVVSLAGYVVALHKWKSKDAEKNSERIEQILTEENAKTQKLLVEMIGALTKSTSVIENNTEALNIVRYKK